MANTIKLKRGSGSDPSASDLAVGEVAVRTDTGKLFTKKDDNSVTEIGVTGNAASADTVDVSGVTTNSALQVLFSTANSGSAKIIAVDSTSSKFTYNPSSNTLNVDTVVGNLTGNVTGNTSGSSGSCTGNAATATALATARTIAGVSFDGSANISLNNNAITNGAGYITATLTNEQVQDIVGGMVTGNTETGITVTYQDGDGTLDFVVGTLNQDTTGNAATATALETARNIGGVSFDGTGNINLPGVNTSGNQDTSGNAATATKLATARTIAGVSFDGSANISLNNNAITNGAGYITATLTNEQVQDIVGAMVSGNTESGISVTYQDSDGTLDFSVTSQTDNNFTTTLKNKLDGIASGATNVTNTNQLTNGAGFITSADGGNAATLDSIDSSQFLRSDANDSASGILTLTAGLSFGADARCAASVSSLSDGSTITVDFTSGIHHSVTLGGNRTFGNPSNDGSTVGQSGSIFITQDGTGSRTASFHSDYKFVGGTAPTLSTAANAVDRIDYVIKASGVIHCAISLDVK